MSVDMNQTIAEASLDNLHDIIVPEPIGFFPLAPGWVMVALLLLALFFHFSVHAYKRYKKSLYKREALAELGKYTQESREETLALLALAKRVAIVVYGRVVIAKLTGEEWWDFMEKHSKAKVSKELRIELSHLLYSESYQSSSAEYRAIKKFVTTWIKTHKGSLDV